MLFYPESFKTSTPNDREIAIERDIDAPRPLVFDAFTRPELVRRWLLGFREIVSPERLVATEKFDDAYPGEAIDTACRSGMNMASWPATTGWRNCWRCTGPGHEVCR